MKKVILLLLTLVIISTCYSQIKFGVKSGINIATTRDLITFPKNRLGWYGGGFSQISIHNKLFFQSEINFSSKGYRYEDLSDGKMSAMKLNYLTLPLLVGYGIDNKTKVSVGPELGYLVKAINNFNAGNVDATSSFPKKIDVGLAVGLQYDLIKSFGIEARYIYGLKTFYQTDVSGLRRSDYWAANRAFQLGIYYIFLSTKSNNNSL